MRHGLLAGFFLLTFVAGIATSWYVWGTSYSNNNIRIRTYTEGELTSPLLECGIDTKEILIGQRAEIEKNINAFVEESLQSGVITKAAIYYRDLNNGPWFGIGERDLFSPGSLLKLPIAISYYWQAQREPGLLDKKIQFSGDLTEEANESDQLGKHINSGAYSVRGLIASMLKESSNDAADTLARAAGRAQLSRVYQDLGITEPKIGEEYKTDVKTYAAFFRVLYNASYIGQPGSEELLEILAKAAFTKGLVAGVPSPVIVAHKFGTRVVDGKRQLHDCGIVYAGKSPYVLCVMSQGNSTKSLSAFIAGVSKRVYDGVIEQ